MKVSRSKTEYMCVNEREGSGTVRLQGEEVKKVQEFKYLGSTVQSNGECGKGVKKRVQAGWNGWRKVSGVLCDQKISARIKGKVYRTVVRPAMLYGVETMSLRKRQESELEVAELKMLRTSINFRNLSNSSSSVGSDQTGQPSLPMCINKPWLPMTLSPVHHCSSLGPRLIDTDHCRPGTPHKSCSFVDALIQLFSHLNLVPVKLSQIIMLVHFFKFEDKMFTCYIHPTH
ncbi:hypothetical protein QTP86_014834 [Hemibagrus guttatus]|nr:hypothetical protein QTP86_014834 [Hemibagrus guttatus]